MDSHIIKNFIYIIILLGILIYLLYFLNPKDILNYLSSKEHLVNLYKPNKVFYHNNKIYLIDTQNLIDNENPKIFNNFDEFQKYILKLKKKHLIKLPLQKEDIEKGINNIKNFKYEKDLSINQQELPYFKNSKKCYNKIALCNSNTDNIISDNLMDKNDLIDFKKKECNNKLITIEKCKEIGKIINNEDELNKRCYQNEEKSDICEKYNKYRWNQDLLKNFCVKNKNNYDMEDCLIGEYFKENLLEFDII